MKKLLGVLMLTMFVAQVTSSVSLRRRQADDQEDSGVFSILGTGLSMAESLPGVGSLVSFLVNYILDTFNAVEDATNSIIARLVGGAMPCQISLEIGVQCTGITDDNSLGTHLAEVIEQTPLPGFAKGFLEAVMKAVADPASNAFFGGMPTSG